ncbi:hypothetical protein Dsin_003255 [Dipteronia sinensis]|uniref:DC1 domain-containing protein n=1 Tax=Dipteronia sinensis TaxID=43782 RepID=A0AAE0B8L7_9ROSI|nr:hypothetical protein Dsin_003255 [Dipteronia sinensis]
MATLPCRLCTGSSPEREMLRSFSHPFHTIVEVNINGEYTCNGCNTLGHGKAFRCTWCSCLMHDFRATYPPVLIDHSHLHPHSLSLQRLADLNRCAGVVFCDICGNLINGESFSCLRCAFVVHPVSPVRCCTLPTLIMP